MHEHLSLILHGGPSLENSGEGPCFFVKAFNFLSACPYSLCVAKQKEKTKGEITMKKKLMSLTSLLAAVVLAGCGAVAPAAMPEKTPAPISAETTDTTPAAA